MDAAWLVISSSVMQSTTDHDALAYRARAEAALLNAGSTDLTTTTLTDTLTDLWAAQYTSGTAQPGFGLDYTFDAFGNGSTNPADTIYSYTSAVAALAFLDGHEILGGSTQLNRAKDIVDMLLSDCWGWSGNAGAWGCVWYSDQAADQTGNLAVNNINALLLAALARIDIIDAAPYDATKRGLIETFTTAGQGYNGVSGRWRYYMGSSSVNDLAHHAYMVLGTAHAEMGIELQAALSYMWTTYLGSNGTINTGSSAVMGTNKWGPGDALMALCQKASWEIQARILAIDLAASVDGSGVSSYADPGNARSFARYALGLATYGALIEGDGALLPPP